MTAIVDSLSQTHAIIPGMRIKTLRGSSRGVVIRVLNDGKLIWKSDTTGAELTALPESVIPD